MRVRQTPVQLITCTVSSQPSESASNYVTTGIQATRLLNRSPSALSTSPQEPLSFKTWTIAFTYSYKHWWNAKNVRAGVQILTQPSIGHVASSLQSFSSSLQKERAFTSWRAVLCSVMSDSLWPRGLKPTRLLCPWGFSSKSTRVGGNFLLQGILLTQGSSSHLLHWQVYSLPLGPVKGWHGMLKLQGHFEDWLH